MIGMLSPQDQLNMRKELSDARMPYQHREVLLVVPTVTSGSNYENFTDSPYDISGPLVGQYTATYDTYRLYARIKIVKDTTTYGVSQIVTGFEIGDYLLYFRDTDKAVLDQVVTNKNAYFSVDGLTFRPWNDTLNGVAGTFDVFVHGKKFSPRFRKPGT